MSIRTKVIYFLVIPLTLFYFLPIGALYLVQEKIIFHGSPLPENYTFNYEANFEEINIPTEGASLNALHFKLENPKGFVFFLHGNAGNLKTWVTEHYFKKEAYDLFIFDYRGYGKSSGKIQSEQQLHADVRQAWDFINKQYDSKKKVIYGRSLGTSLAVNLATRVDADSLILVSPFISMHELAKQRYPLMPMSLLRYPLRTDFIINKVTIPTLIMTGELDELTPPKHSQHLISLMQNKADFEIIRGAGHGDIHGFTQYQERLAKALQ